MSVWLSNSVGEIYENFRRSGRRALFRLPSVYGEGGNENTLTDLISDTLETSRGLNAESVGGM